MPRDKDLDPVALGQGPGLLAQGLELSARGFQFARIKVNWDNFTYM